MNPFLLTLVYGQHGHGGHGHHGSGDQHIIAVNGTVDKSEIAKSVADYKKFVDLTRVDKDGNIVYFGNKDAYEEYKYGVDSMVSGHKDIELTNNAEEFDICCSEECIGEAGYTDCEGELKGRYCCQTQQIALLEKCPKGSIYYQDKCWVESKFEYVCLEKGFYPQDGKCIKHEEEPAVISCPSTTLPDGPDFQPTDVDGKIVCKADGKGTVEVCEGYWLNGDCYEDVDEPTCPNDDYTKVGEGDNVYCELTWKGECTIKVPNLRGRHLGETRNGWTVNIQDTINKGRQARQKEEEPTPSPYDDRKATLEGSRAIYKAKQSVANVRNKAAEIRANIEKQRNLKLALEAYIATKEPPSKSPKDIGKSAADKVFYESNKHIATECEYKDIVPASQITTSQKIPTTPQEAGDIIIPAEKVCISPGFVYDNKYDICVIFAEKKQVKRCSGVVSQDKCLANVAKDATCPEPWQMVFNDEEGVPKCERVDVKPGKFSWVGNFECVGDPKYCEALFKYKGH